MNAPITNRKSRITNRALLLAALALLAAKPRPTPTPSVRRIAIRATEAVADSGELERVAVWAKRRGIELAVGSDAAPVPGGWEAVYLAVVPPPPSIAERLSAFPISFEPGGFAFDGRSYRDKGDAIRLSGGGTPAAVTVVGNSAAAAVALAARTLWRGGDPSDSTDYSLVSGELSKSGRFAARDGALGIDRSADRDQIAERDAFFRSLTRESRGAVEFRFADAERGAVSRWEPAARKLAGKRGFAVRLFPDAAVKALYTGSSRPADLTVEPGASGKVEPRASGKVEPQASVKIADGRDVVVVDVDASAPEEPDLITPVLAAAARAADELRLLDRPTILLAVGARRAGRWWKRDVSGFAAFLRAAGAEPTVEEVLASREGVSSVLAVGAAAAWLDAGVRLDGDSAVDRALVAAEPVLAGKLERWREAAGRRTVSPPPRRPLPSGFLRGVSYAMTNSIEEGYVSPRSGETLRRLAGQSVNAISLMPFGFSPEPHSERIEFVHRHPQGETDEGTVRAAADARAAGMSVMVKPQLWIAGSWPGEVVMKDEASWRAWFAAYRRFLVHHAIVAEAAGAALFCVGTELKATEVREKEWRDAILAVRLATGAPLLYAANWAVHAPNVPFWDALDAIGVDFYDPLAATEKATDAALEQGARTAARPLAEIARKFGGRPVILTEAGYPPLRAAWIAPHDEDAPRPAGGQDAARAIAAVYRALGREPWWRGVFWWKVFSDGRPAPPGERGFNLLGTPAEKAVVDGFRAMESRR